MVQLVRLVRQLPNILSLPEVTIRMSGDSISENTFRSFVRPHPRYRFIQSKRWGVALLPLPDTFEEYLQGKPKQALRSNRNRAMAMGYHFTAFRPSEHITEIMAINTSMETRQARPMHRYYLDAKGVRSYFEQRPMIYGVFDANGALKAYASTPLCGEMFYFSMILGHGDDLEHGTMYLLVSEVIREMIGNKQAHGAPLWAMYDTFFGAAPGLRYFKERLGFKPYKVRWLWRSEG